MTDERLDISRRKALAALGTIGVASAGAGLGTSAYFSDTETFENNQLVAGTLDLKVTASQHYVDWLPDTDTPTGNVSPPAPQETDDAEMADGDPDIRLGPGGIDGAEAIELDLVEDDDESDDPSGDPIDTGDENALEFAIGSKVNDINGGVPPAPREESLCTAAPDADGNVGRSVINLQDVKPGDFGFIRFEFASCDNPAFLWYTGEVTNSSENGYTEPELDDPDEDGPNSDETVELLDNVVIGVVEGDVYQELAAGNQVDVSRQGTLSDLMDLNEPVAGNIPAPEGGGAEGVRDCFEGENNYRRTLVWWVPIDHGNEIQGDSATFELGLYAEQCRHNDGQLNNDDLQPGATNETDDDAE